MKTQEHRSSPLKSHTQSEYEDNNMQSYEAHLLGSNNNSVAVVVMKKMSAFVVFKQINQQSTF